MSSKLEDLLQELGQPGRQQLIATAFLIFTTTLSISSNHLLPLVTLVPPHHCTIDNQSFLLQNENLSTIDSCQMYVDPANRSLGVKQCDRGYTFQFQDGERQTVASEWELVCDKRYLVRIYQTISLTGVTIGGIVFGYLADAYGRFLTTLLSTCGQIAFGVAMVFVTNFEASCVLGFLRGFCLQGMTVAGFILIIEMFNHKYRTKIATVQYSIPALGMTIVVLYNYPISNWRYQILAFTCTTFVSLIGLVFFTKESIRWLLSQNKIDKARDVVNFTVKFNGIPKPDNLENKLTEIVTEIQSKSQANKSQSFIDVMRHPFLRKACLIQFVGVLGAQMCIYGFSFLIGEIGGNIHINFTIASLTEFAFRFTGYFMMERWGRKTTTIIIFCVMSLSNFVYTITNHFQEDYPALFIVSMVVAIVGRIFNGLYFVAAMLLCTELSPTTVRSSIFGAVNTTGRFGLVFLPFLLLLGDYVWKQLPFIVFGVLSLLSAFLFSLLPETRGIIIPNTIEEAGQLRKYKFKSNAKNSAESNIPDLTAPMLNNPTT